MDKDVNRNNVYRTAGIAQESFWHSKCLTHPHHVDMHLERLQIIKSKGIQKKEAANMKNAELVDTNKKIVGIIFKNLPQEGIIREDTEVMESSSS